MRNAIKQVPNVDLCIIELKPTRVPLFLFFGNAAPFAPAKSATTSGPPFAIGRHSLKSFLYRVPEIVTRGRFPDGGESDSTWRTQEARHVGSDTIAPGF